MLVQFQKGVERVIVYARHASSSAEKNYSTIEKECLVFVWAITKVWPYLYQWPFRIISDHHSFCWLANLKNPSGCLIRYSLRLQELDLTILYRSGQKHADTACLCCAPVETAPKDSDKHCGLLSALATSNVA